MNFPFFVVRNFFSTYIGFFILFAPHIRLLFSLSLQSLSPFFYESSCNLRSKNHVAFVLLDIFGDENTFRPPYE